MRKLMTNLDNLFVRYGDHHIIYKHPHCSVCKELVEDGILYDKKCEECYDNEYSGCYGGGCIGGEG